MIRHEILLLVWLLFFFVFFILFPLVFNFYIIPMIEQKIGEKLKFTSVIYTTKPFFKWFYPAIDVGVGIVIQYLIWKITKKVPEKKGGYNPKSFNPIMRAHYDISKATLIETLMSILVASCLLLFIFFMSYNLL